MSRLWSRVGIRALSVALLVTGVVGGVYLGRDHQTQQRTAAEDRVVLNEQAELDLLKARHAEHAAARASQRAAEADAAEKAATAAKAAATRARKLEAAVIKKKVADKKAADAKKAAEDGAIVPYTGPIPASCNEYSGTRAVGCAILLAKGFGLGQMPCLDKLWKKESGWNPKAHNKSSGAYGIPQSLPGSKMASAGADWRTNPKTQILWGLGYIKGRYKSPCGAWSHSQAKGWY